MKENFLNTSIDYLKGVGPNRSDILKKEFQIFTYNDLLNFFPFRYIDRTKFYKISEIQKSNADVQIIGRFTDIYYFKNIKSNRLIGTFSDGNQTIEIVWFKATKWIEKSIKLNTDYVLYGKPNWYLNNFSIAHPELSLVSEFNKKQIKGLPAFDWFFGPFWTTTKIRHFAHCTKNRTRNALAPSILGHFGILHAQR